jgi:hypothetical protein
MKKLPLIVATICLIPVIVFGTIMSMNIYRSLFNPYLDRTISGEITITDAWVEISPHEPLRADREIQEVVLAVKQPVKVESGGWGLVLTDGSTADLEVQIIDEDGNIYNLTSPTYTVSPGSKEPMSAGFGMRDLPKNKTYRTVRIRSSKPLVCARIYWRCYYPEDMK